MQVGPNLSALRTLGPVLHRLRFAPAQVADGRLRERNPLETANAFAGGHGGLDDSVGRLDAVGSRGAVDGGEAEQNRLQAQDCRVGSFHGHLDEIFDARAYTRT